MSSHFQPWLQSLNAFDIAGTNDLRGILRSNPRRVVLRFHRVGCPPCDAIVPTWLEYSRAQIYKPVTFVGVNVEQPENGELMRFYKVDRTPTFVCLENGVPTSTFVGADPAKLRRMIETGRV
jgi:thiol-disulfide isomerase/thioredoxin